jgi:hypothetical protein
MRYPNSNMNAQEGNPFYEEIMESSKLEGGDKQLLVRNERMVQWCSLGTLKRLRE